MASMRFSSMPTSVSAARKHVREVLGNAVSEQVVRRVELAASELATNAVQHAGTPFVVDVELLGDIVRLAVTDTSALPPVLRDGSVSDAGGRGLILVTRLSTRWGFVEGPGQKTVWCEISVTDAAW